MNARDKRPREGFSLVEVTLAIGVASFCLISVFGLLMVGLKTQKDSIEQTAANGIFSAVGVDLRATATATAPDTSATSALYQIPIPANPTTATAPTTLYFTSDGTYTTTLNSQSRYRLTITFQPNGTSAQNATYVHLKVTWPAALAPDTNPNFAQTFLAITRG